MKKFFRRIFTVFVLCLVGIQYQNCSNTTDGPFWGDGPGPGTQGNPSAGYAQITSSSAYMKIVDQFTEVAGVCNPGVGQNGTLNYEVRDSSGGVLYLNPAYSTTKCDSGRFNFIVPKPPCSLYECRYTLRAQLKIGTTTSDIPEYSFKVSTAQ